MSSVRLTSDVKITAFVFFVLLEETTEERGHILSNIQLTAGVFRHARRREASTDGLVNVQEVSVGVP